MKYLKTHMIFESLDKHFKLSESILKRLKDQNPKVNDVEDIMLEVIDSWGFSVPPSYMLRDSSKDSMDLRFQKNLDYFGMDESDFDEPEEDYKSTIKFIDDIRSGKRSNLVLDIDFQYANEYNSFKPLSQTDEQKEILSEVDERLKSIGCEIDYDYSPEGSNLGQGLWKITISVPVKFQPENVITSLDGFSKNLIKDFGQFVKDYSIDTDGQVKLSNLIRRSRMNEEVKNKIFESVNWSPEDTLSELTWTLKDAGLEVKISDEDTRFHGKGTLFVLITDVNRVFCKKYPEDDLDWLVSKDIMKEFFNELADFGVKRDKDYKVYGGGLSVTLVFNKEGLKSAKL